MTPYREVFKDYPYNKLLKSLGDGRVDLNTNYVEIGQIYIIVRKDRYFKDESEDLSMVKKILPLQLKTMFSPPFKTPPPETLNLGRLPNGLVIRPLDASDTFIMSCWGGSSDADFVGVPFYQLNDNWSTIYFKYVNLHDLKSLEVWNQDTLYYSYQRIFQTQGEYNATIKNLSKWGYIFKIPIDSPINQFINWTSNPFI
tara:strand:- start:113 stop:709 length:597 start_codon:yes stop_codon:yes gene_type:complete